VQGKNPIVMNKTTTKAATTVTLPYSPTMTRTETHRTIAALEKAIERLQLLSMLDEQGPEASAARQSSAEDQNRGVGGILEEQKRLEARYEHLIVATQKVKHNPMDPLLDPTCFSHVRREDEEVQLKELQDVSKKLKEQSKMLCRQLKDNPNDVDNWKKIVAERAELIALLTSCVREMQTSCEASDVSEVAHGAANQLGRYEAFAKKVVEEKAASQWAEELVRKENETNQSVKQLQNEVKYERAMKEEELEKRHRTIAELKTELRVLKQNVKEQMEKLKSETESASEAQHRAALDAQRQLNERLSLLRELIHNENTVNADMHAHIDTKISIIDDDTSFWTAKNQEEQRIMDTNKHNTERERVELADKLREALEKRDVEEVNKKARDEEQRRRADDRSRQEATNLSRYAAATKVQASLKGFFTRQILVVLKKKAGKKKKK
jgi:hypothetical protein